MIAPPRDNERSGRSARVKGYRVEGERDAKAAKWEGGWKLMQEISQTGGRERKKQQQTEERKKSTLQHSAIVCCKQLMLLCPLPSTRDDFSLRWISGAGAREREGGVRWVGL